MDDRALAIAGGVVVGLGALAWYHSRRRCPVDLGPFSQPVEPYAPSEPVNECDPVPKPGAQDFRSWVIDTWGGRDGGIERDCGADAPTSTHHEGRAWDWFPPDRATADAVIACLLRSDDDGNAHALARRAGLRVIIYYERIWNAGGAVVDGDGWAKYKHADSASDRLAHRDHVHFSFGWDGAMRRTSLFEIIGPGDAMPVELELARPEKPNNQMGQIRSGATRTPVSFAELRDALAEAHELQLGGLPSPARLRLAWSMVNHETDQTRSMWNHNVGNIACTRGWPRCHALKVRDPTREPVLYRSYDSLVAGAADWWRLLAARYPHALLEFDQGDAHGAARELKKKGYFGQAAPVYAIGLERHALVYDRAFGPAGDGGTVLPLLLVLGVAAAGAYYWTT